ncbi:hypothetical protein BJ928_107452 [Rhizobium sp. WW_1]|jgi:hypothetical protein|nr:hypothetical protein BJ928_107452 [Rhizobium sp. WW_1]
MLTIHAKPRDCRLWKRDIVAQKKRARTEVRAKGVLFAMKQDATGC